MATKKNVAMNKGVRISFRVSILSPWCIPKVELLDHIIVLFLVFEETPHCFPQNVTIYIPNSSAKGFPFLHIFASNYLLSFLIIDILTGLRCYLIVVFICMSLMINDVEHFFMCLLVICISSWKKMSILVFSPFKKLGGFIFWFELFICFEYKLFIGHIICKYFLPFNRLSFHFVDGFLCCTKAFKFN